MHESHYILYYYEWIFNKVHILAGFIFLVNEIKMSRNRVFIAARSVLTCFFLLFCWRKFFGTLIHQTMLIYQQESLI